MKPKTEGPRDQRRQKDRRREGETSVDFIDFYGSVAQHCTTPHFLFSPVPVSFPLTHPHPFHSLKWSR